MNKKEGIIVEVLYFGKCLILYPEENDFKKKTLKGGIKRKTIMFTISVDNLLILWRRRLKKIILEVKRPGR